MSAREMQEWVQYDRVQPFGAYREDLRTGFVAWVIYSVHQPPKKDGGKPMTLSQFMEEYWPDWLTTPEEREKRRQEKVQAKAKSLFGGS